MTVPVHPAAEQPVPESATPSAAPGLPSPPAGALRWDARALADLFFRPTRFFTSALPFARDGSLLVVAWIAGMSATVDRMDRQMTRADLGVGGTSPPSADMSWGMFWVIVVLAGLLSAMLLWYVWAWWYRVRLRWSGAREPDPDRARAVYFYASLVAAGPALLVQLADTFRFESYAAAWNADDTWKLLLLIFPFWACAVSYRGVRAAFDVRPARARFWFLIAPIAVYLVAFGIVGAAYSRLESEREPEAPPPSQGAPVAVLERG